MANRIGAQDDMEDFELAIAELKAAERVTSDKAQQTIDDWRNKFGKFQSELWMSTCAGDDGYTLGLLMRDTVHKIGAI